MNKLYVFRFIGTDEFVKNRDGKLDRVGLDRATICDTKSPSWITSFHMNVEPVSVDEVYVMNIIDS